MRVHPHNLITKKNIVLEYLEKFLELSREAEDLRARSELEKKIRKLKEDTIKEIKAMTYKPIKFQLTFVDNLFEDWLVKHVKGTYIDGIGS